MGKNFFKTIITINEVDSTMDFSKKILTKVEPPFIVLADIQKKGRGQHGREWSSKKGGLWLTNVFKITNGIGLSTFFAIPIMRALRKYISDVQVKWPNDIFVSRKKLGGILVEIREDFAFVGIGLNVQNEIPNEIKDTAISLLDICKIGKRDLFNEIINQEEGLLPIFLKEGFKPFKEEYQNNLILLNKDIWIQTDTLINGKVIGVSDNGELLLKCGSEVITIINGTVKSF